MSPTHPSPQVLRLLGSMIEFNATNQALARWDLRAYMFMCVGGWGIMFVECVHCVCVVCMCVRECMRTFVSGASGA